MSPSSGLFSQFPQHGEFFLEWGHWETRVGDIGRLRRVFVYPPAGNFQHPGSAWPTPPIDVMASTAGALTLFFVLVRLDRNLGR